LPFRHLGFFAASPQEDPFQFVFDRGCFHVFDEPEESARFSAQVAAALAPAGLWLSLIGSTEDPPREVGPPRRSAGEVILAIEPALEIVELRTAEFRSHGAKAGSASRAGGSKAVARAEAETRSARIQRHIGSSLNPRPLRIIGTHLSVRAARVLACFAPEI
jgi:hypothetical protein